MRRTKSGSAVTSLIFILSIFVFSNGIINAQSKYFTDINNPKQDSTDIYFFTGDRSDIFTMDQDLIDVPQKSLYESIYPDNYLNSNPLLIVKNNNGEIISVIDINKGIIINQPKLQD